MEYYLVLAIHFSNIDFPVTLCVFQVYFLLFSVSPSKLYLNLAYMNMHTFIS